MRHLLPVLLLAWCIVSCGCAESPAPEVGSPTDGAIGYVLGEGEVVFRFDALDFDNVTRNDTGKWLPIGEVDIKIVSVAGDFNDWSREAWRMVKTEGGVFELRKEMNVFADRSEWQFKFVINDFYWVEPPAGAQNSTAGGMYKANRSANLILTVP
jgi:hypothetical protein